MIARRVLGLSLKGLAVLVICAGVWFAAGLLGAVSTAPGSQAGAARSGQTTDIYLVGSAIHYDFLLPATPEVRQAFAFAAKAGVPVADAEWVLVGWGAREFYTATGTYGDMRAGPVWKAVTGDASVLRVDAFGPLGLSGQQRIRLNDEQVSALVAAIAGSTTGQVVPDTGFTETDAFFVGRGRFHLLRTCNVWIGEMLRAAGLPFGRWTPTPTAVRLSLGRLEAGLEGVGM